MYKKTQIKLIIKNPHLNREIIIQSSMFIKGNTLISRLIMHNLNYIIILFVFNFIIG